MPPKRCNDAASTSRARKRAKLEEEDSDESYHSSSDEGAGSDADSDPESSYSEPLQTTRKRSKPEPAKRVVKSRATEAIASSTASVRDGRVAVTLEVLLEQPLDIVLEIFSYLAPFDVLHLTRTSKTVRKAFLNPASRPCWNVTWMNSKGLPPCPEDMAIPAFVSLMYEAQCFRCGKTNQVELCMVARARFCKDCYGWLYRYQKFTWDEIETGFRTDPYMLETVVPVISPTKPRELKLWKMCRTSFKKSSMKSQLEFCVRFEDIAEFKCAWKRCPIAERIHFLKDRQAKILERREHAMLCYDWISRRARDAEDQQVIARETRYHRIVAELRENGWGSVLDDMTADEMEDFRKLPDVRKTQKMNKRSVQTMLPRLEPFLQRCKRNHARRT